MAMVGDLEHQDISIFPADMLAVATMAARMGDKYKQMSIFAKVSALFATSIGSLIDGWPKCNQNMFRKFLVYSHQ